MQAHLPWFSQGDILERVPIISVDAPIEGSLSVTSPLGPAVLLTHGCAMDKASRAGKPSIRTLHFAPLVAVSHQDPSRQRLLRAGGLTPYEVMHLGDCGPFGESFIVLSQMYALPTAYFVPTVIAWPDHPAALPDDRYCTPSANASRVGRLDDAQVDLLKRKMNAFWTRLLPKDT